MAKIINDAMDIAIPFIKKWEGVKLDAYQCSAGVWTIGYGETKGVKRGDKWTLEQAEANLPPRVKEFMASVLKVCPHMDSANQLAACTSLCYNIGQAAFKRSTVARYINTGDIANAANAFLMWHKANGKVIQGLVNRRKEEKELFLS